MALPPQNPDKTAAGIIVDPKTLERVVPTSARKDGSLRKELKIRPGFTPQEDVGRFRGSRQLASEQASSRIPGSNRTRPPASASSAENPFASTASSSNAATKTKAQVKNEKRRASKKAGVSKAWDESDDEEDDGGLGDAFKAADEARKRLDANEAKGKESKWPVEDGGKGQISEGGLGMGVDGGGIPDDPVPVEPKHELEHKEEDQQGEGTTAILSPPPPGEPRADPIAPTAQDPKSKASSNPTSSSNEPEWRTATSRNSNKPRSQTQQTPHPIQGGRKGPIGLAHPPPIEDKPTQRNQTSQARGRGRGRGQGPRRPDSGRAPSSQQQQQQPQQQETKKAPEPRVRKEVKVRETGLGSLADRVRGLVISNQNQGDGKKKEKAATPQPTAST